MFSIETPRLILRDLLETDLQPFYELSRDPEVIHFQDFLRLENEEKAFDLLNSAVFHNNAIPRRAYSLAIIRKQDMAWIGYIGFGKADDPTIGDIEFGYAIDRKYRGNGYMTEALRRIIHYCFQELRVQKMYGGCVQENRASARVMEKAGLRLELSYPDVDDITGKPTQALRYTIERSTFASTLD